MEALTPSYIYLVPSHNLIDAERRAFFVEHSGHRPLESVTIALLDNRSGVTPVHIETYARIDSGSWNPLAPRYFWFTPASLWDEDYTITITSSGNPRTNQRMVVRSTHHTLQFAVEVTIDGRPEPVFACRDRLMPNSYTLAARASETCDMRMAVPPQLEDRLDPAPYGVELPNGNYVMWRLRTLPDPRELEAQSENRHLWEYQKARMVQEITKYAGAKLLILTTSGEHTQDYAKGFYDVFANQAHWDVTGPRVLPAFYESMIDVQVSADNGIPSRPEVLAVINGLKDAGVKCRKGYVYDPDVKRGLIVLWIGPKSPDSVASGACAPVSFKPGSGERKPCESIAQTLHPIPFPPP